MRTHSTAALLLGLRSRWRLALLALSCTAAAAAVAALAPGWGPSAASASTPAVINAIGAENEYANVLSQIGGKYVHVSSILNNPNTDPHTFEASPSVAREVSGAELIVAERRGLRRLHGQDRGGVPQRLP